jgi:hypothetical protein
MENKTIFVSENNRARFQQEAEKYQGKIDVAKLVTIAKKLTKIYAMDLDLVAMVRNLKLGFLEYLIIDNVAIDSSIIDVPTFGIRPENKSFYTSELSLIALVLLAGLKPLSYVEEKGNTLIHEISPIKGLEETLSNAGIKELGWHTDNSFIDISLRPDFLSLLSLINEPETETCISSAKKAFILLSKRHQTLLMEPLFRISTPDSYARALNNKRIVTEPRPIINLIKNSQIIAAGNLYGGVQSITDSAEIALRAFKEALEEVEEKIILTPGKMLIFENNKVFHRRGKIDEGKRWLQRLFAKYDIDALRQKNGKTLNNKYIFPITPHILAS